MPLTSNEIRDRFLRFFEKRGHVVIPSASLVPENDPTVLFTTAGMQPLIPYLLGKKHPSGTRLVNSQKCVRTQDIDKVGDNTHDTFFEMLGNWSLGDYFKREAIEWSYEFLTSAKEGLGLDPLRLFVTCFEGDLNAPRDEESAGIWREIFDKNNVKGERIYFRPADKNWWSVGENGPCGPDTEMFYDVTGEFSQGMTLDEYLKADEMEEVVEIWNDVFMEYEKKDGKIIGKLKQKNVDTGAGLERLVAVVQEKKDIFETDLFLPIMEAINKSSDSQNQKAKRIVADHIRTAVFIISDGVTPGNTDRGYVLRRLLRRAIRFADVLGMKNGTLANVAESIIAKYQDVYSLIRANRRTVVDEINKEEEKFRKTLGKGLKEFEKVANQNISGEEAFILFSTYGFPIEMTEELAREKGISVDLPGFKVEMEKHKELSRTGAEQKFKNS